MLAMMRRCAVPMFDKGWFKVKVKKTPLFHVARGVFITFCDSYSLRFHLPLNKIFIPSSDIRGDMIAFVSESTRLVHIFFFGKQLPHFMCD